MEEPTRRRVRARVCGVCPNRHVRSGIPAQPASFPLRGCPAVSFRYQTTTTTSFCQRTLSTFVPCKGRGRGCRCTSLRCILVDSVSFLSIEVPTSPSGVIGSGNSSSYSPPFRDTNTIQHRRCPVLRMTWSPAESLHSMTFFFYSHEEPSRDKAERPSASRAGYSRSIRHQLPSPTHRI
ncbi:hypothetical protein BDV59DRAFT_126800 [Aspergillus ambiguus]|uniref:uncharacterized protein n=1 Tax=Aspergillus ambiguus TaxID=176160 RepID=UPI003CCDC455